MDKQSNITLKTDTEFMRLSAYESEALTNLLEHELIDLNVKPTIHVWRGYIVDGHKRYNLCQQYCVPFNIRYLNVETKEEAIIWKCSLLITEKKYHKTKFIHYYLGKYYVTKHGHKTLTNPTGHNQYTQKELLVRNIPLSTYRQLADSIGKEAGLKGPSIYKYAREYRYLEAIYNMSPLMANLILSEKKQLSYDALGTLSKLTSFEMSKAERFCQSDKHSFIQLDKLLEYIEKGDRDWDRPSIRKVSNVKMNVPKSSNAKPQIKVTPSFDPDAEISSLFLTIPSWISSMNRVRTNTDFSLISSNAGDRLKSELNNMTNSIKLLINELEVLTNE